MSEFGNDNVMNKLCEKYGSFMFLKVCIDGDNFDLKKSYMEHIFMHNAKVFSEHEPFFDSGFDLFFPNVHGCVCEGLPIVNKIDFKVKCSASMVYKDGSEYVTGYMLFPRSSLSKTPLRLANSVGVIDSGYSGNIIGMFDCRCQEFKINYMDRLVQICAPTMCPIYVELVEKESGLGMTSSRGDGGFGSSGR
uniref:dUTPase-like domain-containing protein n=1 Tax=viral metagenome TaxID=1070528 RepID=A0A6C0DP53_9ZZZZ